MGEMSASAPTREFYAGQRLAWVPKIEISTVVDWLVLRVGAFGKAGMIDARLCRTDGQFAS